MKYLHTLDMRDVMALIEGENKPIDIDIETYEGYGNNLQNRRQHRNGDTEKRQGFQA